jgi:hypothetical protein
MSHMPPKNRWEGDQDAEQIVGATLDQNVLTEESALLHAREFIKYNSPEVDGGMQMIKYKGHINVAGIISLLLIGKLQLTLFTPCP